MPPAIVDQLLQRNLAAVSTPDVDRSFASREDAFERLTPYHIFYDEDEDSAFVTDWKSLGETAAKAREAQNAVQALEERLKVEGDPARLRQASEQCYLNGLQLQHELAVKKAGSMKPVGLAQPTSQAIRGLGVPPVYPGLSTSTAIRAPVLGQTVVQSGLGSFPSTRPQTTTSSQSLAALASIQTGWQQVMPPQSTPQPNPPAGDSQQPKTEIKSEPQSGAQSSHNETSEPQKGSMAIGSSEFEAAKPEAVKSEGEPKSGTSGGWVELKDDKADGEVTGSQLKASG